MALDEHGRPRFWLTIWASTHKASLSDSTRANHLYAVEWLYKTAQDLLGEFGLDRAISDLDFDALEAVLGAHFSRLNAKAGREHVSPSNGWNSARQFLLDILRYIGGQAETRAEKVLERIDRIERLYGSLMVQKHKPPAPIRALPVAVIEDLNQIFLPNSNRNPFRSESLRWRNYLIFQMMLHLGIRRSELALLSFDAFKSDYDIRLKKEIYWLNVTAGKETLDPRYTKPSLKTRRSSRQIPVPTVLVELADAYLSGYRGKHPHAFFFSSQEGRPISVRTVNHIFNVAADHLSPAAANSLSDQQLTGANTHNLRHTAAAYRLSTLIESGVDLPVASERLRAFFGWEIASPMPRHYARSYFESEHGDFWSQTYAGLLEHLRKIGGQS